MSLQRQKSERAAPRTYLEILVIRVAGQWFGLRSDRQIHLLHFEASQLRQPDGPALAQISGLLGELGEKRLPVLDLAYLLELPTDSLANQLVQLTLNGQTFGFAIEQAQEIQRVALAELHQLPPLIKHLHTRAAVWAVWQRSAEDLIPLLDFNFVLDNITRQALQPEHS